MTDQGSVNFRGGRGLLPNAPTEVDDEPVELTDAEFLREVAAAIFTHCTPAMGLDGYHVERLRDLARQAEADRT